MSRLNPFSSVTSKNISDAAEQFGSPIYLYDERLVAERCRAVLAMPNAYGLEVRYAMKANSGRALLRLISAEGLGIDASSMNEVRRARLAGIPYSDIILTTQEAPFGEELASLQEMMLEGLKYNVCSLRQLHGIGDFAAENGIKLAIRVHPGVGSGESATRNTGDKYSCFGVHLTDIESALEYAQGKRLVFDHVHVHIGSGADPEAWRQNIDLELSIIEKYFPHACVVSFGGGLKEARMPDEEAADIRALGEYAKLKLEEFCGRTGRKLKMEIEPGTYITANAGYVVTRVIDKKKTGEDGLNFVVLNGGMELNARPLLYASRHPFYIVSEAGELRFSEFFKSGDYEAVFVGRCCESGDSQCLSAAGVNTPCRTAEPEIGDIVVIGGAGAYCSSMSPMNYNSHLQVSEILLTRDGTLKEIRRKQTLSQLVENEI